MTTVAERTPITTFQDIPNAMAQHPELKEQMREHLRDEELCNLPQTVARLAETLAELSVIVRGIAERQERIETNVAEIKIGQARHDADIAELKAGQQRMQSDINRLSGSEYERRIARSLRRNSRHHFGISNGRLVQSITIPNNNHIPNLLDQTFDQGVIGADDADNAERTDIVIHCTDSDHRPAYVAIEASVTIETQDIIRARERADIISKAAGIPATAAACGSRIDEETSALAGQYGVTVIIVPA